MDDIVGKFWTIIIGCVLCFIIPIAIISAKADDLAEEYVEKYVHDFVDNAASTARITDLSFTQMTSHVMAANSHLDIAVWHSARYQTPVEYDDGSVGTFTAEEDYDLEHILSVMYPNDYETYDYVLKEGDYLQVVITQTEPTLSGRILNLFFGKSTPESVYETYGRYIGNDVQ